MCTNATSTAANHQQQPSSPSQSIFHISDAARSRLMTAKNHAELTLSRLNAFTRHLNELLTLEDDLANLQVFEIDAAIARYNLAPGSLCGVPISVNDNLCTRSISRTEESRNLNESAPPSDTGTVQILQKASVINLRTPNVDKFGMGSCTALLACERTSNPVSINSGPGRWSGGSVGFLIVCVMLP